jgi:hypothetical protein
MFDVIFLLCIHDIKSSLCYNEHKDFDNISLILQVCEMVDEMFLSCVHDL